MINIPDGPRLEDLRLSEEAADMSPEKVRRTPLFRWALFFAFLEKMSEALKCENLLDEVSKVLGEIGEQDAGYDI